MTDLRPLALPDSDDALTWLTGRCDGELTRARRLVDELKAAPPSEPLEVLRRWNEIGIALANASSVASLMSEVHPLPAVREAADAAMQRIDAFSTDLAWTTTCSRSSTASTRAGSTRPRGASTTTHCVTSAARASTATRVCGPGSSSSPRRSC